MHSNTARELRYAGEFCVQQNPVTGAHRLCLDNNSGTFAPALEALPLLKLLFEVNFPDIEIEVFGYSDPRLAVYKESTKVPVHQLTIESVRSPSCDPLAVWASASPDTYGWFGCTAQDPLPSNLSLSVEIISARNLRLTQPSSSLNPYVVLGFSIGIGVHQRIPCVSSPITFETASPTFDFSYHTPLSPFGVALISGERALVLELFSFNPAKKDDFLGLLRLTWPEILQMQQKPTWFQLRDRLKETSGQIF